MNDVFDAWHMPGLRAEVVHDHISGADGPVVRYPLLEPSDIEAAAERLLETGAALRERPAMKILDSVAAAAARLARSPLRDEALQLLPRTTGYSPAMAELVLDRMLEDWSPAALRRLVEAELGSDAPLDGFAQFGGASDAGSGTADRRSVHAVGPRLAFHVFSGNVPGVAVTAIIRCLLLKAPVLGKTAAQEPVLPVLFARALSDVDPLLGRAVAVTYWPGGSAPLEHAAASAADTVVVYGGEAAVRSVSAAVPMGARLVVHGPRISVAFVAREALADDATADAAADGLAAAASIFDQHGCVSPHVAYVERGGAVTPDAFSKKVAAAMRAWSTRAPRGRLSAEERAAIRNERDAAEFRGLEDGSTHLVPPHDHDFTVLYQDRPDFTASCLNRFLRVIAVDELAQAGPALASVRGIVQTAGVACGAQRRIRLASWLADLGFSRVCALADMPWPPPTWHHDGAGPLRELVRWIDLEPE